MASYAENRKIKQDRIYKTLGRMTWWRIVAGILLLIFVLLLTGTVSRPFASRGQFKTAQMLLIVPSWMQEYKPQETAYISAGVKFEDGQYEEALREFLSIDGYEDALRMASRTSLILMCSDLEQGRYDEAFERLSFLRAEDLSEEETKDLSEAVEALRRYFLETQDTRESQLPGV